MDPDGARAGSAGLQSGAAYADLRALVRGIAPLFVSVGLLNVSNYAFHVVATRILLPPAYGGLSGLLALIIVISVPCGVLQTVVAKRSATLAAEGRSDDVGPLAARTTRGLAFLGAAMAAAVVAIGPIVAAFLHVGVVSAFLLAPYAFFAFVASGPLGVLQGQKRFAALGWAMCAGVIVRFVIGVALMYAGWGITGALIGSVFAQAIVLAVSVYLQRLPISIWRTERASFQGIRGELASTFAAITGFWLFVEADIALARHFLGAAESGIYAAAGILSRAILFLPAAISLVALPHFAEAERDIERSRRWLRLSLFTTGALAFGAATVLAIFGRPFLSLTFGTEYVAGARLLPFLAPAMACLALMNVLLYFHIAAGSRAYRLVFLGLVVELALITLRHGSGQEIALVLLGVGAVVTALLLHAAHAVLRWRPEGGAAVAAADPGRGDDLELSIVLPCHNAASSLGDVLDRLDHIGAGIEREIIVVSDGSTDDTVRIASAERAGSVRVLSYEGRVGKGHALRLGLRAARGRYVAFMDADGDIDPASLEALLTIMKLYEPDIVLGSKRHPLSDVSYPPLRRLLSWTYHKLTRLLFRVNVRDTQAGLKLIRRDVLVAVLPRMLEKRFAFDLELLVVARRLGYRAVFEAPIRLDYRFASHVDARAAFRILLDTMAIFYRRFVLDTYKPDAGKAPMPHRIGANGHRRILIVNWRDIRNPEAGGAEVVTHEVAKRWVERGDEVTVLTSRFPGAPKIDVVDGVRVRRIGHLRAGTFHLRVQWELATLRGYDVVIDEINTIPFFTPLWRNRLPPTIGLIHQLAADVWDAEMSRPIAALGRWLEPRMLRLYRDVPMITVSDSTKKDLESLGVRNVRVVRQGCEQPPSLHGVEKADVPTFLFVGRLAANKRPDHAVEAFRLIREELPDARLWIVGRGPMKAALSDRLPPGAEMLGFLPREQLYLRMAEAHCLLVTSVREGWGLVITEANGVGTPAVAYDVPGVRDAIVDGRTGWLTEAGQIDSLARTAVATVSDAERYQAMCAEAQAWARGFSWDRTTDAFSALLDARQEGTRQAVLGVLPDGAAGG